MTEIVKADENIFLELGFPAHEAEVLQLRADLMARLRVWINDSQLTQAEVAKYLGITQTRVSNLATCTIRKILAY
jgi:predicted XRE-type DNA-binding protein